MATLPLDWTPPPAAGPGWSSMPNAAPHARLVLFAPPLLYTLKLDVKSVAAVLKLSENDVAAEIVNELEVAPVRAAVAGGQRVSPGGVDDEIAEGGDAADRAGRDRVAAAGEGAAAEGQRHGGGVGGDRVAVGILDRDGHGGADRRAGGGARRLLDERQLGGGGGVDRERAEAGVEVGVGVGGPQDVAAGRVDDEVRERGDAVDGLRGDGGLAVGEGAVAERQRDRGGVADEDVGVDVLDCGDEGAQGHAGRAARGLLEIGHLGGRRIDHEVVELQRAGAAAVGGAEARVHGGGGADRGQAAHGVRDRRQDQGRRGDARGTVVEQRERPLEAARGGLLRGEDELEPIVAGDRPGGRGGVDGHGGRAGAVARLELDLVIAVDAGGDEREAGVEPGGRAR